ncbi:hypothetical protein R6Q59_012191 [Mikania micrantha]|uniref:VQ domain-containing protein n=1 Tax=Mikania micrantha TaxID=192012 RepID=A0A5N6LMW8_9ASTR|nr:hypothetical protein E3N88_40504 [Mikania micrantha]
MSPRKFLDGDHKKPTKTGVIINGQRPTPLKLQQESHSIHKHQQHQQSKIIKPMIIYLRSPEVIHTKPHEFMALVQKLTGYSGSKDQEQQQKKTLEEDGHNNELYDDSGVTNERNDVMKSKSPMFNTPSNPQIADIPLFTPNTSDYFFSPRRLLGLSGMVSSSPSKNTSFSPSSLVDLLKRLPEC